MIGPDLLDAPFIDINFTFDDTSKLVTDLLLMPHLDENPQALSGPLYRSGSCGDGEQAINESLILDNTSDDSLLFVSTLQHNAMLQQFYALWPDATLSAQDEKAMTQQLHSLCAADALRGREGTRKRKHAESKIKQDFHHGQEETEPNMKKPKSVEKARANATMLVDMSTATIMSGDEGLRRLETTLGLGDIKVGRRILSLHVARQLAVTRFQQGQERSYTCKLHSLDGTPRHLHCTMLGKTQLTVWSIRDDTGDAAEKDKAVGSPAPLRVGGIMGAVKVEPSMLEDSSPAQGSAHDYSSIKHDVMHNTAVADVSTVTVKSARPQKPYRFCTKCWFMTGEWTLRSIAVPGNECETRTTLALNGHRNGICPIWPSGQIPSAAQDRRYATAFKAAQKQHTLCCVAVDAFQMHKPGMSLEDIQAHVRCNKCELHSQSTGTSVSR